MVNTLTVTGKELGGGKVGFIKSQQFLEYSSIEFGSCKILGRQGAPDDVNRPIGILGRQGGGVPDPGL